MAATIPLRQPDEHAMRVERPDPERRDLVVATCICGGMTPTRPMFYSQAQLLWMRHRYPVRLDTLSNYPPGWRER